MKRTTRSALALGLAAALATGTASAYTNLYAFGDSLSDSGSVSATVEFLTGTPLLGPPYAGRGSNGPVAVEYLAASLGLSALPAGSTVTLPPPPPGGTTITVPLGGTNYAQFAGATANITTVSGNTYDTYLASNPTFAAAGGAIFNGHAGIDKQVAAFAAALGVGGVDPKALYSVWGGANDAYIALEDPAFLLLAAGDPAAAAGVIFATATESAGNVGESVAALAALGARHFLVPNIPDLGLTPTAVSQGPAAVAALSLFTDVFNATLAGILDALEDTGLDVVPFDVEALLNQVAATPDAFGFVNTTSQCILEFEACAASGFRYLFWDGVHPTTYAHSILGGLFARAVPEPATVLVFLLGLALIARRFAGRAVRAA